MCRKRCCAGVLSVFLCLLWVGAVSADPILIWTFDEGSGDTVADKSGNGNDGVNNGATWEAGGFNGSGHALSFQGGSYVEDDDGQDFLNGLSALTMMAWVKSNIIGSDRGIMNGEVPDGGDNVCTIRYDSSGASFGGSNVLKMAVTSDAGGEQQLESSDGLQTTEWQHVAMTWESGGLIRLYINGLEDENPAGRNGANNGGVVSGCTSFRVGQGAKDASNSWDGLIDEVRIFDAALTIDEIQNAMLGGGGPELAGSPTPENEATDIVRDTALAWNPGEFAASHDVYLGTVFNDVNDADRANQMDVLVGQGQDANAFDAGILEFGQTYYWRIDEVNGAPDNTIFKGGVWSFEVEPVAYPVEGITATASSSNGADMGPEKTIDGSGLDALDQHSTTATDMWLSAAGAEHWIQYEFAKDLKLHEMWVWNSNQMIEAFIGLGAKGVSVETSLDGEAWTVLEGDTEFAQASGQATYTADTIVDFGGTMARFVRITVNTGWGMLPQYGLSEVRFFSIPTQAREPQPASGATTDGVTVMLTWRAGREAASHDVSLGTDSAAMALIGTTSEAGFDPGELSYSTTYFWRVDEVNEAGTPTSYAGELWSFTTPAFGVVDSFDQYDDKCNRIFFAWGDGLGHSGGDEIEGCEVPASNGNGGGSIVGNNEAPFAEKTIVTAGSSQSLPFNYDNAFGQSEATRVLDGEDWTASDVQTLSLAFYGTAGNTGTLYVKINNTKVTYDLDAADIARAGWQAWNIDLTGIGGLQNVTSLTIGVDGTTAAGMLYIDDIRLYPLPGELLTPADPGGV